MKKRLNIFLIMIGVASLLLIGRLAFLQLIMGDRYGKIARFNIIRTTLITAPRGEIRDRKGRVLAYDVPRLNVCAIPFEIDDVEKFAKKLAPLIGYSPERIVKIIKKHKGNKFQEIVIKSKVNTEVMMRVAEYQGDIPGLYLEVLPVREYPHGEIASHIIGYVGEITGEELGKPRYSGRRQGDVVGKDGIEKYYDQYLQGKMGEVEEVVDASGKIIKVLGKTQPRPGYNLYLTLDFELQKECEELLKYYVKSLSKISGEPLAGSVIIMNSKTGEIFAMVSYPGFDPNIFSKGVSRKDYQKLINRKDYPLLNRSIAGAYPAASTFKIVTGSAALQEGICTRYSPFYCSGRHKVGNLYFNCFVRAGHGPINFHKSISESCDVVFYILGESLGIDRLLNYSRQYGIGSKTDIDLPGEISGLLPNHIWKMKTLKEPWYTGDTVNLSIGQGYLGITPLQMAVVVGVVANKGFMYRPFLVKKVERHDNVVLKVINPVISKRVKIKPGHFNAIRDGMREAVLTGTAKRLNSPKMRFAGKTGTAENFPTKENPHGRNHTWFVGMGPFEDPEIILVVFLEKSGGLAGKRAVPLSRSILNEYRKLKNGKN
ncbi:MAG: penicillin-binding protein 2 [Candidatus Eremiobacteraeota bacterium]|nr:penicillin-binding protein 2 [Candidatus Eremiobacteraeota bacterium]